VSSGLWISGEFQGKFEKLLGKILMHFHQILNKKKTENLRNRPIVQILLKFSHETDMQIIQNFDP
jgi:hypothetical protein